MTMDLKWAVAAAAALWAVSARAPAAETVAPSGEAARGIEVDAGADLRVRQVGFDNIPVSLDPPGVTRGGYNHFFRIRTRVWGQMDFWETVRIRARLVNEFREVLKPDGAPEPWEFPDEWAVDTLYAEVCGLFGGVLDVRAGRQDLIYGTGKVILEGTPKDGSRTIYFDAVKLSLKTCAKSSIDLLGIYNDPANDLAINGQDHDVTGQTGARNDITESGFGVYARNARVEWMPFEVYALTKNESAWTRGAGTNAVDVAEVDVTAVGLRVMPRLGACLDASLEAAYQFGEQGDVDIEAYMIDAKLNCRVPALEDMKPRLGLGWYYLSGDDPDTPDKDEGWNPMWARWPQYSELYVYAFDTDGAGRWSNVSLPYVDLSIAPAPWLKVTALVGQMSAPEKNGPGGGSTRGLLATLRADFTIARGVLTGRDLLTGHMLVEVLEPGSYYRVDDTAYFARWELAYAF